MIDGSSLFIIPFLTGVEGADMFNFFFSLVSAGGLLAFIPVCCMNLLKKS